MRYDSGLERGCERKRRRARNLMQCGMDIEYSCLEGSVECQQNGATAVGGARGCKGVRLSEHPHDFFGLPTTFFLKDSGLLGRLESITGRVLSIKHKRQFSAVRRDRGQSSTHNTHCSDSGLVCIISTPHAHNTHSQTPWPTALFIVSNK